MKIQDQKAKLSGAASAIAEVMNENKRLREALKRAANELDRAATVTDCAYIHNPFVGSPSFVRVSDHFETEAKRIREELVYG